MNVTMTEIKKLREMTGAGLADCKKALAEAEDMDGAVAILRKKGQAVAAKRSDREAAEGCVLVKAENGFGAIIALKCETDFVAKNADFVALAQSILDAAVAAKSKGLKVIGLTGQKENQLEQYADVCIHVPETETYKIQELHLPVYHCLCLMLEDKFFG